MEPRDSPDHPGRPRRLHKIATEEAWTILEVAEALRTVVRRGGRSLDLALLTSIYAHVSPENLIRP
jgi:hypothetical protein